MKIRNLTILALAITFVLGLASLASATFTVTLNSPANSTTDVTTAVYNVSQGSAIVLNFTCTPFDDAGVIGNVSLITNMSGSWEVNSTNGTTINGNKAVGFLLNITKSQDIVWSCYSSSNNAINATSAANYTAVIDLAAPTAFNYGNFTTDITRVTGNKTVSANLTPLFNWSASSDRNFVNYTIMVSVNADFSSPVLTVKITNASNTSFSIPAGILANDTSYFFNITAWDGGNRTTSLSSGYMKYITDSLFPVITLASPANNTWNINNVGNFSYSVVDNNIVNCSIHLNLSNSTQLGIANITNTTATNLANNTLIYNNISLQDVNGTGSTHIGYMWNVLCYDAAGQSVWGGTTNRTLFVDSVAPPELLNLTGAITANATATSNLSPSFNWSITPEINFKNYTLEIYNSSEKSSANMTMAYAILGNNTNSSFNLPVALVANLAYYWRVVIWDKAGWSTASTNNFTFTTDTQAPTVSITSPANNTWSNSSLVSFNYTGTDISLRNCTVYVGNTTYAASFIANKTNATSAQSGDLVSGTIFATNVTMPETNNGPYYFWNVLCTDGAGQSTWGSTAGNYTLKVDATAPSAFDSNLPVNFTVSNNQTPTLVWNMTTEQNFKNYTIEISGDSTFAANGSNYTYIATNATSNRTLLVTTALADGMWYWRVTAYDLAGWRTPMINTSFWYEVDTTPPSGLAYVQSIDNWAVGYALNFSYKANDTRLLKNCSLWINNTGTFAQNVTNTTSIGNNSVYNFNVTIPSTQGATFKWNILCSDNVGNTAWLQSTNFTTTVDNLAPNITSTSNATTSNIITFTVNDTPSAVNISMLTITGVPSSFNNTRDCTASSGNISVTCTYTESGLASGTNVLTITARDMAGKMTTYDLTVNTAAGTSNYTVPISNGWNLISTPYVLTNSSITNVVGSNTNIKRIWYYNGTGWQGWTSDGVISTLTTMEPRKGYWVNSTAATTLNFVGKLGSGNPETAYDSLSLSASTWYTIGSYSFEGAVNKSVDDMLGSLCTQQCSSGSSTNSFSLLYHYNGTTLQVPRSNAVLDYRNASIGAPGRGFWIYMESADTYT